MSRGLGNPDITLTGDGVEPARRNRTKHDWTTTDRPEPRESPGARTDDVRGRPCESSSSSFRELIFLSPRETESPSGERDHVSGAMYGRLRRDSSRVSLATRAGPAAESPCETRERR